MSAPSIPRSDYPVKWLGLLVGIGFALLFVLYFGNLAVAVPVLWLFVLAGITWRRDMPPIVAACLTYQSLFVGVGYGIEKVTGKFPGASVSGDYDGALFIALSGLTAIALGFGFALSLMSKPVSNTTEKPDSNFNITRLAFLVVLLFGLNLFFELLPKQIWFGGAQILENLLKLRFVPCFVLIYLVGRYGLFWVKLWIPIAIVVSVQVLSGFSRFKEVLVYVLVIVLFHWRPWIRTRAQSRTNMRISIGALFSLLLLLWFGVLWSGSIKNQWRDLIWEEDLEMTPLERLDEFSKITGEAMSNPDAGEGWERLSERLSSGFYYLSLTIERVPRILPHEHGEMALSAIRNAVMPRFLFPDKPNLMHDSLTVRKYAGVWVAGAEMKTSVGLGYIGEFYIDFGRLGVPIMCFLWGLLGGFVIGLYAVVSPNKEVFFALCAITMMDYFMSFDGSIIKFFAGLIQQVAILSFSAWLLGKPFVRWVSERPTRKPG